MNKTIFKGLLIACILATAAGSALADVTTITTSITWKNSLAESTTCSDLEVIVYGLSGDILRREKAGVSLQFNETTTVTFPKNISNSMLVHATCWHNTKLKIPLFFQKTVIYSSGNATIKGGGLGIEWVDTTCSGCGGVY